MLGEDAVRVALAGGAEEAEAFQVRGRTISISVEKGAIKTASSIRFTGLGVRVSLGNKLGFAYASNPKEGKGVGEEALKNARAAPPDPDFKGLPEPRPVTLIEGLLDPKIKNLSVEEASSLLMSAIESSKVSPKVVSVNGKLEASYYEIGIYSSKGTDVREERTSFNVFLEVASKDGDRRGSSLDFADGRYLGHLKPEKLGRNAGDMAVKVLDSTKVGVEELPVILEPKAQVSIIPFLVDSAANAENIQYGRSFLSDKLGKEIADDRISIVDDGRIPWATGSSSFDDEGIPTRKTYVIEKGTFRSPIYNWYAAMKEGKESTGNAVRGYNRLPMVGAHTVSIEAPDLKMSKEDLLDVRRGILVSFTFDTPNLANGEFSGLAETAFLIENGEITKSLRQTNMAFTLIDMLRSIDGVGDDIITVQSLRGGSIRFKAKVAGPG